MVSAPGITQRFAASSPRRVVQFRGTISGSRRRLVSISWPSFPATNILTQCLTYSVFPGEHETPKGRASRGESSTGPALNRGQRPEVREQHRAKSKEQRAKRTEH